tara:strand:- start:8819 stop:9361 length:543 start_codon:yes stop_codon:yes gene_type:complete
MHKSIHSGFKILFLIFSIVLSSCSSITVDAYKGQTPAFNFEEFFSGNLEANGVFQDRSGKVIKQIHCKMRTEKKGDDILIHEDFVYSDGIKENRTWIISKGKDGNLVGRAGDVLGDAKISTSGFAFNMNYVLRLKVGDDTIDVKMDDWMYRVNEKLVINKTKMSKWGFHLGDVSLVIEKK